MLAGRYAEARAQLAPVTNSLYANLRQTLESSIAQHENKATNSAVVSTNTTLTPTPKK